MPSISSARLRSGVASQPLWDLRPAETIAWFERANALRSHAARAESGWQPDLGRHAPSRRDPSDRPLTQSRRPDMDRRVCRAGDGVVESWGSGLVEMVDSAFIQRGRMVSWVVRRAPRVKEQDV